MIRVDERMVRAPADVCFRVGADVERWPEILPHYRRVRFHQKMGFGHGRVEMAAWRDFAGPLRYPTWWVSDMTSDPDVPIVHYRHVDGITRGMDVRWEFLPTGTGTVIRIVHEWDGPRWPLIGGFAARRVIGPLFVSVIARRTLRGVGAEAERRAVAADSETGPETGPETDSGSDSGSDSETGPGSDPGVGADGGRHE